MGVLGRLFGKSGYKEVGSLDALMGAAEEMGSKKTRPERLLSTKPKFTPRTKAGKKRKRLRQMAKRARRVERLARKA